MLAEIYAASGAPGFDHRTAIRTLGESLQAMGKAAVVEEFRKTFGREPLASTKRGAIDQAIRIVSDRHENQLRTSF